jgi:hypothetical protein
MQWERRLLSQHLINVTNVIEQPVQISHRRPETNQIYKNCKNVTTRRCLRLQVLGTKQQKFGSQKLGNEPCCLQGNHLCKSFGNGKASGDVVLLNTLPPPFPPCREAIHKASLLYAWWSKRTHYTRETVYKHAHYACADTSRSTYANVV